jgi:hypothetical protein
VNFPIFPQQRNWLMLVHDWRMQLQHYYEAEMAFGHASSVLTEARKQVRMAQAD